MQVFRAMLAKAAEGLAGTSGLAVDLSILMRRGSQDWYVEQMGPTFKASEVLHLMAVTGVGISIKSASEGWDRGMSRCVCFDSVSSRDS